MRLGAYGAVSTLVASGVVLSAFNQRANFYSACVYLAQSNACLMILTNFGIFMTLLIGTIVQKVFYGPLRPTEVEHLYEKAWYAVTETCLAMTIFRDEFGGAFIVMFTTLLFLKCFHWLGSDRVDFVRAVLIVLALLSGMEQTPPTNPTLFHTRLASSLFLLLMTDILLTKHCISTLLSLDKPNMTVMFAFEFAILTISCTGIAGRYILGLIERFVIKKRITTERERRRRVFQGRVERGETVEGEEEEILDDEELDGGIGSGWEDKGVYIFYLELCTDLLKLIIYLLFFAIVLTFYGLPLHIIRDVYMTFRSFITRIRDFIRYRKATAHMNSRYPDATVEDVQREGVCIICREDMVAWSETQNDANATQNEGSVVDQRSRPKKLPCGHVLHFACLRSWLERQQRCPTCRRPVLDSAPANPAGGAPAPAADQPVNGAGVEAAQPQQPGVAPVGNAGPAPAPQPAAGLLNFRFAIPPGGIAQGLADHFVQRRQQAAQAQQQRQQQITQPAAPGTIQLNQVQFMQWIQARDHWLDVSQRNNAAMLQLALGELRSLREEINSSTRTTRNPLSTNEDHTNPDPSANETGSSRASTSAFISNSSNNVQPDTSSSTLPPELLNLPPNWTVIPLAPVAELGASSFPVNVTNQTSSNTTINEPSSNITPLNRSATGNDIPLSLSGIRRRGEEREYQNNLRNWHAMLSPSQERSNFNFPSSNESQSSTQRPTNPSPLSSTPVRTPSSMISASPPPPIQFQRRSSLIHDVLSNSARQAHSQSNHSDDGSPTPSASSLFNLNTMTNGASRPIPQPQSTPPRRRSSVSRGSLTPSPNQTRRASRQLSTDHIPLMDQDIEHLLNMARDPTFGYNSSQELEEEEEAEDPKQGRSPLDEQRRASSGEIPLSETEAVWPGATSPAGGIALPRRASGASKGSGMFNVVTQSRTPPIGSPIAGPTTSTTNLHTATVPSPLTLAAEDADTAAASTEEGEGRIDKGKRKLVVDDDEPEGREGENGSLRAKTVMVEEVEDDER